MFCCAKCGADIVHDCRCYTKKGLRGGMIKYIQGDLFTAKNKTLLHACNCHKTWGSGVAYTFSKLYPEAYEKHREFDATQGDIQVIDGTPAIVCLFTSGGFGIEIDSPLDILKYTKASLVKLAEYYKDHKSVEIASPKINAGLFHTPWRSTERLIENFLKETPNFSWDVYVL